MSDFLTPALLKGRIITSDALHTQHAFCSGVAHADGYYILFAKGNQQTLSDDLQLFFAESPADCQDWRLASTCNKGHGRLEKRELVASTELNDFLTQDWCEVAQVFCLTHQVEEKGQTRQEVMHGLSNLPPALASATRLLELIRAHWAIENRLHWRRDVT